MSNIIEVIDKKSTINIPGSKYIANRILMISALTKGTNIIKNVPKNNDIDFLIKILKKIGVKIKQDKICKSTLRITGLGTTPKQNIKKLKKIKLKTESGTAYRFMVAVLCLLYDNLKIKIPKRLRKRPILELCDALNDLGAECNLDKKGKTIIITKSAKGGKTKIDSSKSSQFISALLLIAPCLEEGLELIAKGNIVSKGYINLTIKCMKDFGIRVTENKKSYSIKQHHIKHVYFPRDYSIEKDWSSANYFLAIAALTKEDIKIDNLNFETKNKESEFYKILEGMSCRIKKSKTNIEITHTAISKKNNTKLKGITKDMNNMPDSVPTLAVLATIAEGKTVIKNIEHLKYKESNRIESIAKGLNKLGIKTSTTSKSLIIVGNREKILNISKKIKIDPHNDHRLAMSFGLLTLLNKNIKIKNTKCVRKSFPDYWKELDKVEQAQQENQKT